LPASLCWSAPLSASFSFASPWPTSKFCTYRSGSPAPV
jgi:hypothetical protein